MLLLEVDITYVHYLLNILNIFLKKIDTFKKTIFKKKKDCGLANLPASRNGRAWAFILRPIYKWASPCPIRLLLTQPV